MSRRCRASLLNINWCLRCRDHWESHLKCRWKYFHGRVVWAWGRHELRRSCLLDAGNHLQRNHCEFGRTMCDLMCHVWMGVSWWSVEEEFSGEGLSISGMIAVCMWLCDGRGNSIHMTLCHIEALTLISSSFHATFSVAKDPPPLCSTTSSPLQSRLSATKPEISAFASFGCTRSPKPAVECLQRNLLELVTTPRYTGVHPYLCNKCVDYDKTLA